MAEPDDAPWAVDYVRVRSGAAVHARWSKPRPGPWGGQDSVTLVGADLDDVARQADDQALPPWSRADVLVDDESGLGARARPFYPDEA